MSRRLDVLLVDDDPCERVFIEDALDAIGCAYRLTYVEDGRSALERLHDHRPDVMILDLRMPGLTGFDVLKAVREDPALEPMTVFVVSNSMIEADRKQALDMGAQDYRVKPITSDGYAALVEAVCERLNGA
ncbi:MAG: response regulator [Oceanicaulis sp.]